MKKMYYTHNNQNTTIYKLISKYKEKTPQSQVIISQGRLALSYIGLFNHIHYVAQTLNSLDIEVNDRVATVIPNGPEMATAFLSIASCCTCAPLRPSYNEKDFEFYLKDVSFTVQDGEYFSLRKPSVFRIHLRSCA